MLFSRSVDEANGTRAIIDGCCPYDHPDEFPAVAEASKALQDKIRAKWKDLF